MFNHTTPLRVYDEDVSVTIRNYKYTSVTEKLHAINSLPKVDVSGLLLGKEHLPQATTKSSHFRWLLTGGSTEMSYFGTELSCEV